MSNVTQNLDSEAAPNGEASPPDEATRRGPALWGAVAMLMVVGILNYMDRILPSILAEPLKQDLALSDTTLGLINGVGFLLIYAFASIPIARLSDTGRYGLVIGCSLAFWSAMTTISGWVQAGWQLAIARMGVAFGEAGSTPAAHAFITRNFPVTHRAAALSIFTLSMPLGAMLGYAVGGYMAEVAGWRTTFIAMGVLGLVLAPIVIFILRNQAPPQQQASKAPSQGQAKLLPLLFKNRTLMLILVASATMAIGGYTATAFAPAFLMRTHAMTVAEAGIQFGLLSGVCAVLSILIAGWLADRLAARDPAWLVRVIMAMGLLGAPLAVAAFGVNDRTVALIALSLCYAMALAYLSPMIAAVHTLVPVEVRARASAAILFGNAILGGMGPLAAGVLSEALNPEYGDLALGRVLLFLVPISLLTGALLFALAARTFSRDVA